MGGYYLGVVAWEGGRKNVEAASEAAWQAIAILEWRKGLGGCKDLGSRNKEVGCHGLCGDTSCRRRLMIRDDQAFLIWSVTDTES